MADIKNNFLSRIPELTRRTIQYSTLINWESPQTQQNTRGIQPKVHLSGEILALTRRTIQSSTLVNWKNPQTQQNTRGEIPASSTLTNWESPQTTDLETAIDFVAEDGMVDPDLAAQDEIGLPVDDNPGDTPNDAALATKPASGYNLLGYPE
ncbi:hypothetical protein BD769DRAFT_1381969 [Suillus cothurnatus]|nr:hypothetical protein BD769DRAFT_1381969 [Suillus cothurnatus]